MVWVVSNHRGSPPCWHPPSTGAWPDQPSRTWKAHVHQGSGRGHPTGPGHPSAPSQARVTVNPRRSSRRDSMSVHLAVFDQQYLRHGIGWENIQPSEAGNKRIRNVMTNPGHLEARRGVLAPVCRRGVVPDGRRLRPRHGPAETAQEPQRRRGNCSRRPAIEQRRSSQKRIRRKSGKRRRRGHRHPVGRQQPFQPCRARNCPFPTGSGWQARVPDTLNPRYDISERRDLGFQLLRVNSSPEELPQAAAVPRPPATGIPSGSVPAPGTRSRCTQNAAQRPRFQIHPRPL